MAKKIRVAILFGGQSAEHEVSLLSARNVLRSLNRRKYDPVLIGITKAGRWTVSPKLTEFLLSASATSSLLESLTAKKPNSGRRENSPMPLPIAAKQIDVVFPVLHGTFGEDGTIQGLLKLAGIPFVGAGVLGSAIGMDKDVQKRLLRDAGIAVAKFVVLTKTRRDSYGQIAKSLGKTVFVKPNGLGSSVGVSKVQNASQFNRALTKALKYDAKVLVEEAVVGREIECSVLGNATPRASLPGEVIPKGKHDFYDYAAKYLDETGAELVIPAKLSPALVRKVRRLAVTAFQTLNCEGMARVDMFLTKHGKVIVNEINTIPGFTNISMYPKLWEISGLSQSKLIDRLIQLALERHRKEKLLKTSLK